MHFFIALLISMGVGAIGGYIAGYGVFYAEKHAETLIAAGVIGGVLAGLGTFWLLMKI